MPIHDNTLKKECLDFSQGGSALNPSIYLEFAC